MHPAHTGSQNVRGRQNVESISRHVTMALLPSWQCQDGVGSVHFPIEVLSDSRGAFLKDQSLEAALQAPSAVVGIQGTHSDPLLAN